MNLNLKEKIIIVTGGSGGIGRSVVESFAQEGSIPVILGRNKDAVGEFRESLEQSGYTADQIVVDLTNTQACIEGLRAIGDKYGHIDVLVNNAGVNDTVSLEDGPDAFRQSLEKNLVQIYTCAHACLPYLDASNGNIVNIGSKVSVTGQGGTSGYAASKGGMDALTREWALDLAPRGIRVNCVVPAEVITPMYQRWLESSVDDPEEAIREIGQLIPLGRRTTTEEEIANAVVFVASSVSSHTTGQILYVDGGYTHLDRAVTQNNG